MIDGWGLAPEERENEYFEFLDVLRESGETNMYGAAPYLQEEFGFSKVEARDVLKDWMDTYAERHPK